MILQGDAHIGKVSSMMDKVYAGSDAANVFLIFTPQIFSFLAQWKISSDAAWWPLKTSADFPGDLRNALPNVLKHLLTAGNGDEDGYDLS